MWLWQCSPAAAASPITKVSCCRAPCGGKQTEIYLRASSRGEGKACGAASILKPGASCSVGWALSINNLPIKPTAHQLQSDSQVRLDRAEHRWSCGCTGSGTRWRFLVPSNSNNSMPPTDRGATTVCVANPIPKRSPALPSPQRGSQRTPPDLR